MSVNKLIGDYETEPNYSSVGLTELLSDPVEEEVSYNYII